MRTRTRSNLWITFPHPNPRARLRLFCFPYAGGGASVFRAWPKRLPKQIEVCSIQLPGRENRFLETRLTGLSEMVRALEQAIRPFLNKPFAFFGHSLGALISFELARRLRPWYHPRHLFVSGSEAPQIPDLDPPLRHLPDDAFINKLYERYQGIPKAVMQQKELVALLLPTLRADITVRELYTYVPNKPLDCPITAFGGLEDKTVTPSALSAWQKQTSSTFTLHKLPGDHFFLNQPDTALLPTIAKELRRSRQ